MKKIFIVSAVILLCGCNAQLSTFKSWGSLHKITLYAADGTVIKIFVSNGQIQTDAGGQLYFQDNDTKYPVYVYGTYVVEILPQ